jgi:hypothetical protein
MYIPVAMPLTPLHGGNLSFITGLWIRWLYRITVSVPATPTICSLVKNIYDYNTSNSKYDTSSRQKY